MPPRHERGKIMTHVNDGLNALVNVLYDLAEDLRCAAEDADQLASEVRGCSEEVDRRALEIGREKILNDSLSMWHWVYIDGDGKQDTYDEWLRRSVRQVPGWVSRDEFLEAFNEELRKLYLKDCLKAVAEKKAEEAGE